MKKIIRLLLIFFVCSCSPSNQVIQKVIATTLAEMPTFTPYATFTPYSTLTPVPTYTFVPTYTQFPTYTYQPTYTPQKLIVETITITITPKPQNTPLKGLPATLTLDSLHAPHGPGFYLVGVDIAPGIWRSDPTLITDNCYWEITDKTGEIMSNHYGMAGGTMYISPNAFQVMMEDECGMWTFLRNK